MIFRTRQVVYVRYEQADRRINKTVFDERSPLRSMFPIAEIQKTFQRWIEADCQM